MRLLAVVEIARDGAGRIPAPLALDAYRASRAGLVMLVLDAVSPREIDAALDPAVRVTAAPVHGVLYVDATSGAEALAAAREASVVVASTDRLRAQLDARGVAWLPPAVGSAVLGSIASGAADSHLPEARAAVRAPARGHKLGLDTLSPVAQPRIA